MKKFLSAALAFLMIASLLSGCNGNKSEKLSADKDTQIGSVKKDGYALSVPVGAVESDISFTARLSDEKLPHDSSRAISDGKVYEFTPETEDGISRFYEPIIITLAVSDEVWKSADNPMDLCVCCWNGEDWDYLSPDSVDEVNRTLSIETYHCSLWGTAAPTTEEIMREVATEEACSVFGQDYSDDMKELITETIEDMLDDETDPTLKQDIIDGVINNMTVATDAVDLSNLGSQNIGDYAQLIIAAKNGNTAGVEQNFAAMVGRAITARLSESPAVLNGTWDNLDLIAGSAKGMGYLSEGDNEAAAKEFAKAIMSTNVITKVGMTGTEIIVNEHNRWKDEEIEKAYQIYLNGNSPSRWSLFGYGEIEAGDFDEIWNQMRGISRHLLAEKETEFVKKYGSITDSERSQLELELREETRAYFEKRKQSEDLVNAAINDNMKILLEMEQAELFTSFYGYDYEKQTLNERMHKLLAMKDAILADTGLKLAYVNSETTISVEALVELMMPLCVGDKQGYLDALNDIGYGWKSSGYPIISEDYAAPAEPTETAMPEETTAAKTEAVTTTDNEPKYAWVQTGSALDEYFPKNSSAGETGWTITYSCSGGSYSETDTYKNKECPLCGASGGHTATSSCSVSEPPKIMYAGDVVTLSVSLTGTPNDCSMGHLQASFAASFNGGSNKFEDSEGNDSFYNYDSLTTTISHTIPSGSESDNEADLTYRYYGGNYIYSYEWQLVE